MKAIKVFICIVIVSFVLANCNEKESISPAPTNANVATIPNVKMSHQQQVEYGKYLVEIAGCNDCHSPKIMTTKGPIPDHDKLLSGHPSNEKLVAINDPTVLQNYVLFNMNSTVSIGPWGTSFAGNLTPDETGLGNWTIDNFEQAIRFGKFKGQMNGRTILPPMPWQNYSQLTNKDLAAIWEYLKSIPPVKNIVPTHIAPSNNI